MSAWARLYGVLLAGLLVLALLSSQGARTATALAAALAVGCCTLWSVRALPVHFAPLLALWCANCTWLNPAST